MARPPTQPWNDPLCTTVRVPPHRAAAQLYVPLRRRHELICFPLHYPAVLPSCRPDQMDASSMPSFPSSQPASPSSMRRSTVPLDLVVSARDRTWPRQCCVGTVHSSLMVHEGDDRRSARNHYIISMYVCMCFLVETNQSTQYKQRQCLETDRPGGTAAAWLCDVATTTPEDVLQHQNSTPSDLADHVVLYRGETQILNLLGSCMDGRRVSCSLCTLLSSTPGTGVQGDLRRVFSRLELRCRS